MLVRLTEWETVREQFSDEEKDALNLAVTGEAICPRGVIIDEDKLPSRLKKKLVETMPSLKKYMEARG